LPIKLLTINLTFLRILLQLKVGYISSLLTKHNIASVSVSATVGNTVVCLEYCRHKDTECRPCCGQSVVISDSCCTVLLVVCVASVDMFVCLQFLVIFSSNITKIIFFDTTWNLYLN